MASRQTAIAAVFASVALACGLSADRITAAAPGERTLSFYHIHTKETLTVTYKKDGRYIPDAMKKIDWVMRDWRKNQSIRMDPETIDLIWEMHSELGSQKPIHIICGYRSHGTNQMLRRKVGGQASQSQHITGRAIDLTFPDVPLKRMRYSALIRERGGVGYYPTSGIPFVHVDTSRVRAWPRLPRYELALLFPSGHTKHRPSSGGAISSQDVQVARGKYQELASQIAQFHSDRRTGRGTLVAAATPPSAEKPAKEQKRGIAMASLGEALPWTRTRPAAERSLVTWEPIPESKRPAMSAAVTEAPKLVSEPKLLERPSRFTPAPSKRDRSKLAALIEKATNAPMPKLVSAPKAAPRPAKAMALAALPPSNPQGQGARVAALIPERDESASISDMSPESLGNGWVQAPEFDEDHPEELAYRPFPLAPLLTEDPAPPFLQFGGLQHPDVARTLETLDDIGAVQPMRFRPGQQLAEVMWAQQFKGGAVHLDALEELDRAPRPSGIENRQVQTTNR